MKYLLMTVLIGVLSLPTIAAPEPAPAPKKPEMGQNAALIYWQLFGKLSQSTKSSEALDMLADYATVALDDKVRALLNANDLPLQLLQVASTIGPCDWGLDHLYPVQGIEPTCEHLGPARLLSKLALLNARVLLADKKSREAAVMIIVARQLGRHLAAGGLGLGLIYGYEIEDRANQLLAEHFGSFSAADVVVLKAFYAKMPPVPHVKEFARTECAMTVHWMRPVILKGTDADVHAVLSAEIDRHLKRGDLDKAEAKRFRESIAGPSRTRALAMMDEISDRYAALEAVLDLKPVEFTGAYAEWTKRLDALFESNLLSLTLIGAVSVEGMHARYHRCLAISAITDAAIALRLFGKAEFDAIKDPYGDGPFDLKITDAGIEISSKFKAGDSPFSVKMNWKPAK